MKVIIGYGSPLHSDDTVGCRVAEVLESWNIPDVKAIVAPQLLPELAEVLAQADMAVFVDALNDPQANGCTIDKVTPNTTSNSPTNHFFTPENLLALTQKLFGSAPKAYSVAIPARNFGLGTSLSSVTTQGMSTALWAIKGICDRI
jgi:hydrogenase maturation protease